MNTRFHNSTLATRTPLEVASLAATLAEHVRTPKSPTTHLCRLPRRRSCSYVLAGAGDVGVHGVAF